MGRYAKETGGGGSDFKPLSAGTHAAVCVSIIDLGLQKVEWQGEVKWQEKVYLRFEVPSERVNFTRDGEEVEGPAVIGATVTNSLNEKAKLRKWLENWRGKSFTEEDLRGGYDLTKILGVGCILSVTHNQKGDKTYANITGISGLMKGMEAPQAEGDVFAYFIGDPETAANLEKVPQWARDKMNSASPEQEYAQSGAAPAVTETPDFDDDIPF